MIDEATMTDQGCGNCKYWDPCATPGPLRSGECRRYPPNVPVKGEWVDGARLMTQPMTYDEEWCGEWKAKGADHGR